MTHEPEKEDMEFNTAEGGFDEQKYNAAHAQWQIKQLIEAYVAQMQRMHNEERPDYQDKFQIMWGTKRARIVHTDKWKSRSVHCFIDIATGDILKSATWSDPQPNGKRGNVQDEKKPIFFGDFYIR